MVLRLSFDEAKEIREALSEAHLDVLRKLSRGAFLDPEPGLALCRRKWTLESLLRQLERPEDLVPILLPPILELVPETEPETLDLAVA